MTEVTNLPPASMYAQQITPATSSVERDHRGRVVCSRFVGGQVCQFRYDANGTMYGFTYGRLAWSTQNGYLWNAADGTNNYVLDGYVSVAADGTVTVEKRDVTRTLRLDGRIIDEFANGTVLETVHSSTEWAASDLLATVEPKAIVAPMLTPAICEPFGRMEPLGGDRQQARRGITGGIRFTKMRVQAPDPALSTSSRKFATKCSAVIAEALVKVIETVKGPDCLEIAPLVDSLAKMALDQRRIDDARLLFERSLKLRVEQLGRFDTELSINLHGLGRIYHEWGRYWEAEQYYLEASALAKKGLQKARFLFASCVVQQDYVERYSRRMLSVLHSMASLYHEQRKRQSCEVIRDQIVEISQSMEAEERAAVQPILDSVNAMLVQIDFEKSQASKPRLFRLRTAITD